MKIQSKFTLTIAAISFVSLMILGMVTHFNFSSTMDSQTETSTLLLVEKEKNVITERMEKEEMRAEIFMAQESLLKVLSGKLQPNDIKSINEQLAKYVKDNPIFEYISIFDKNAVVVANSDPSLLGKSFSDKDYAASTLSTGKVQISKTLISDISGKPVIMYTSPVIEPSKNSIIGFIGIPLYVEFLADNILNTKINNANSSTTFIIDVYGNYVYSTDFNKLGKPNDIKEVSDIVERLQKGENVQSSKITYEYDGQKMVGAYSIVDKTKWIVVIAAEESELSASLMMTGVIIMVVEILIIILSTLAGFFLSRRISKPILCISENLDRLALGDLDVDIPKNYLKHKDEIGKLSWAMQNIVSNLQEKSLAAEKIANGDFSTDIKISSDKDVFSKSMLKVSNSIKELVSEVKAMTEAFIEGNLDVRGNPENYRGEYCEIVNGINMTLDTVIQPIKDASDVLSELAKGNLKAKVTRNYKGHHATIKNILNSTMDALSGYIDEISRVLTEMSQGNLDVSTSDNYNGDFIKIKESLDNIIQSFNTVLGNINTAAEQVANGTRQVSESAQVLSQGATEQASSVEELTASMEQIAHQTRNNASTVEQVRKLAVEVKDSADNGNTQMGEMISAMNDINISSGNISKIIKVIDEIAFQTNILALNAAVEAARAGQHGKGFAVVAEEVRNLAARSASAAKETTILIESSIKKTTDGMKIANDTANALTTIVDGISKTSDLINEIAGATNNQASAISQINTGVTQVSQVTQHNSAIAQESAAASEEISGQAEVLKYLVGNFKLKNAFNPHNSEKSVEETKSGKNKPKASGKKTGIALNDNNYGKY